MFLSGGAIHVLIIKKCAHYLCDGCCSATNTSAHLSLRGGAMDVLNLSFSVRNISAHLSLRGGAMDVLNLSFSARNTSAHLSLV